MMRGEVMGDWDGGCGCGGGGVLVVGLVGRGEGLVGVGRVILVVNPTAPVRGLDCLLTGVCLSLPTNISSVLVLSGLTDKEVGENDSCRSESLLDQSMSSIAPSSSFPVSLPVHIDGDGDGDMATLVLVPASALSASPCVSVLPGLRA